MATLNITEFGRLPRGAKGELMPMGDCSDIIAEQKITYTSSAQSNAFNAKTRYIRLYPDAKAHIAFGTNPTATDTSFPMPANQAEYVRVERESKVAAYDGTS